MKTRRVSEFMKADTAVRTVGQTKGRSRSKKRYKINKPKLNGWEYWLDALNRLLRLVTGTAKEKGYGLKPFEPKKGLRKYNHLKIIKCYPNTNQSCVHSQRICI